MADYHPEDEEDDFFNQEEELPDAQEPEDEGDDPDAPVPGEVEPPLVPIQVPVLDPNQPGQAPAWAQLEPGQHVEILQPPEVHFQIEPMHHEAPPANPYMPGEIAAMNPDDVVKIAQESSKNLMQYLEKLKGKVVDNVVIKPEQEKPENKSAKALARESDRMNLLRSPAIMDIRSDEDRDAAVELLLALTDFRLLPTTNKRRILDVIVKYFPKILQPLELGIQRSVGWANLHLLWSTGAIDSQVAQFFHLSSRHLPGELISQDQAGKLDREEEKFEIQQIRIYPQQQDDIERFRDMANIIEIVERVDSPYHPAQKTLTRRYHPGSSNLTRGGGLPVPVLQRNQVQSMPVRDRFRGFPCLTAHSKTVLTGYDTFSIEVRTMLTNQFHEMQLFCVLIGKYHGELEEVE